MTLDAVLAHPWVVENAAKAAAAAKSASAATAAAVKAAPTA
jgi:hypothetical protein